MVYAVAFLIVIGSDFSFLSEPTSMRRIVVLCLARVTMFPLLRTECCCLAAVVGKGPQEEENRHSGGVHRLRYARSREDSAAVILLLLQQLGRRKDTDLRAGPIDCTPVISLGKSPMFAHCCCNEGRSIEW
jgi:hypothetical protein